LQGKLYLSFNSVDTAHGCPFRTPSHAIPSRVHTLLSCKGTG